MAKEEPEVTGFVLLQDVAGSLLRRCSVANRGTKFGRCCRRGVGRCNCNAPIRRSLGDLRGCGCDPGQRRSKGLNLKKYLLT